MTGAHFFLLNFNQLLLRAVNSVAVATLRQQHLLLCERPWPLILYITNQDLGLMKAFNLLGAITNTFTDSELRKVIHVSKDGSNVNLNPVNKWVSRCFATIEYWILRPPLYLQCIQSCNNQKPTGWELMSFLQALCNLFKHSPARQSNYTQLSKSTLLILS